MARRYTPSRSRLADATQEGYLGLLRAIELFDPDIGIRFGTYATWWIRRAVTRDMLASSTIRIPESVQLAARRHRRCSDLVRRAEGRTLSEREIALSCGDSEKSVRHALRWGRPQVRSLDQPAQGTTEALPLASRLADHASQTLFERSEQRQTINSLLQRLTHVEADVIRAHYGLDGSEEKKLAQIGKFMNVSRETVRQIERRALLKLRELALD
jgi:RNA polymerase sigma factor (sigma-70 family)